MQLKAIYEDGAINFAQPFRFKHRKFEVVSIPEEELESGEIKSPLRGRLITQQMPAQKHSHRWNPAGANSERPGAQAHEDY